MNTHQEYARPDTPQRKAQDDAAKAPFPMPLRDYLDVDREGWVSFNYPCEAGAFMEILRAIDADLSAALRKPARDKAKALRELAAYVARQRAEHDLIHRQWMQRDIWRGATAPSSPPAEILVPVEPAQICAGDGCAVSLQGDGA